MAYSIMNSCVDAERLGYVKFPEASMKADLTWDMMPLRFKDVEGPAKEAGLKNGDILLEFDGTKIEGQFTAIKLFSGKKAGDYLSVRVNRNGYVMDFVVKLVSRN